MKYKKLIAFFSSILFLLIFWWILAACISSPLILPFPYEVLKRMGTLFVERYFWKEFVHTLFRVLLSFTITVFFGTVTGFLASLSDFFNDFLQFPLTLIRSTPVISVILLAVFWFSSNTVPVFVSVIMTLPVMITAVHTGLTTADKKLLSMAKVFRFSTYQIYRYIKIPNCRNHFFNGALNSFGLSWKVVVAGEVLSLPKYALGTDLQRAQIHLESADVLAITVILLIFSFILEKILRTFFFREVEL